MRTPMVDDVKHKWVKLNKRVVEILRELDPATYEPFIEPDGTLVVEKLHIIFGKD